MAAGGVDRSLIGLVTSIADRSDLVAGVENRLREVAKVVRRSMLDTMPDGEPSKWLYAPMREYPSRPGKALRPALCVSAGRVFGANADDLLGVAVAIELLQTRFWFTMTSQTAARCGAADLHSRRHTA